MTVKCCPFCAEEIRFTAIKCRYCSEFLDPEAGNPPTIGSAARALLSATGSVALGAAKKTVEAAKEKPAEVATIGGILVGVFVIVALVGTFVIYPIAAALGLPALLVAWVIYQLGKKLL